MKIISCSIVLALVLFNNASAQDLSTTDHTKNIALKFAPAGLGVGKITFGAEYNFRHRNSLTLLAGVPFNKTNTIQIDGDNSDISSNAFSLMTGFRHYFGKKTMSGFYVEPYVKYLKLDAKGLLNKELQGENAIFDTHGKYEGIGIGAQLGFQVIIAKLVVFDLYVIGPEANSAKASTISTDITNVLPWSFADQQQVQDDIKATLKDIPVIGDKIEVKVDNIKKTVTINYSGFIPGFRAGASIGIRL
ncbi:MAG: hypothetical protein ABIN89_11230 [Chitinophagaceae bacterium]